MKRSRMIAYSAGSLGTALSMQCFNAFAPIFYMDVLKLSPALFGIGMTIYAIWNAINDPLVGHISDRTQSRWGRRIPYIAFLTLPLALSFMIVWICPFNADAGQITFLFIYFLVAIHLLDTLWTFVVLNWTALFPEMYPDGKSRAVVSGWRQLFSVIGLILGIALPPMIYGQIGWPAMGVLFGVITGVSFFISLWGSEEKKEFSREKGLGFREALIASFRSRSFRWFLLLNIFIQFVFETLTASLPFYAKYVLGIPGSEGMKTSILLGVSFIVAMPMLYVWTKVTQRIGARKTLLVSLAIFGLGLIPFLFVGSYTAAVVTMACAGAGLAGLIMLTDLLLADIVDEDELATGVRREGMFFGMNGFVIRFSIAMKALVMSGIFIATGYDAHLAIGQQPSSALLGLRLLISIVPLVGVVIACLGTWAYPLHGERLGRVKTEVARLHEEKARRLAAQG